MDLKVIRERELGDGARVVTEENSKWVNMCDGYHHGLQPLGHWGGGGRVQRHHLLPGCSGLSASAHSYWVPHRKGVQIPRQPVGREGCGASQPLSRLMEYLCTSTLPFQVTAPAMMLPSLTCVSDRWWADSPKNQMLLWCLAIKALEWSPVLRLSQWKKVNVHRVTHHCKYSLGTSGHLLSCPTAMRGQMAEMAKAFQTYCRFESLWIQLVFSSDTQMPTF